ncbi:MAG: hypothetical protein NUK63_08630 [Candidatus Bathyarchaeum tardum]|nr:MAG: hypothetical protein NUK63_08630 [Candidatus Bathyarchaeum tardum]
MLIIISVSFCSFFVPSAGAIVPEVQNVIFWNDGTETILNVTIYHTPLTSLHYVNQVEVDIEGAITSYPVTQTDITFTTSINLGEIAGTPLARVRAFCILDGWSSWTNQQSIPEFSSWIIVVLSLATILALIIVKKRWRNLQP